MKPHEALPNADARAIALAGVSPSPGFDVGSARDIETDGEWLRDHDARYVLLRGVNFGSRSKLPPYLPILPLEIRSLDCVQVAAELDRIRPDLARMSEYGVNVVRLLVLWKGVEPIPVADSVLPPGGREYLSALRLVADALYAQGIFVFLDFHQDIASEVYGGDGFPEWAVLGGRTDPVRYPDPASDWGLRYYDDRLWLLSPELHTAVRRTLRAFWRDDRPLVVPAQENSSRIGIRAHLEHAIGLVASFFRDDSAILGYELLNEPHPVGIPKRAFERDTLALFYGEAIQQIRKYDSRALILLEPRMDWTTYPADSTSGDSIEPVIGLHDIIVTRKLFHFTHKPHTYLDRGTLGDDQRLLFAFHFYDPWLMLPFVAKHMGDKQKEWPSTFGAMESEARRLGLTPIMTEFGCSQDWVDGSQIDEDVYHTLVRACIDLQMQQVEQRFLNATYWNYDLYTTLNGHDNWNQENLSLLSPDRRWRDPDIMARPYPMRSSAKPDSLCFDIESRQARLLLVGELVSRLPTVVYVPRSVRYPDGFDIRATSQSPITWDPRRQLLYWMPDSTRARNVLTIAPRGRQRRGITNCTAAFPEAPLTSFR